MKNMPTERFSLKACEQEFSDWLTDSTTRSLMQDEPWAKIDASLKQLSEAGLLDIANALSWIKIWEGVEGAVSVLKGNQEGWSRLQGSLHCAYWSIRIFSNAFEKDTRRRKRNRIGVNPVGLALGHAMSVGDHDVSGWLAQRMLKSLNDGAFGPWDNSPYEPFIMKLYCRGKGDDVNASGLDALNVGVYQAIFDNWIDGNGLSKAVEVVCDYHVARSLSSNDESFLEFAEYPYNIFPVDALAIMSVRKRLNLEAPLPRHTLIDTPLARVPTTCPRVTDGRLLRVFESLAARSKELGL